MTIEKCLIKAIAEIEKVLEFRAALGDLERKRLLSARGDLSEICDSFRAEREANDEWDAGRAPGWCGRRVK